jgi:hypothetical protein
VAARFSVGDWEGKFLRKPGTVSADIRGLSSLRGRIAFSRYMSLLIESYSVF